MKKPKFKKEEEEEDQLDSEEEEAPLSKKPKAAEACTIHPQSTDV